MIEAFCLGDYTYNKHVRYWVTTHAFTNSLKFPSHTNQDQSGCFRTLWCVRSKTLSHAHMKRRIASHMLTKVPRSKMAYITVPNQLSKWYTVSQIFPLFSGKMTWLNMYHMYQIPLWLTVRSCIILPIWQKQTHPPILLWLWHRRDSVWMLTNEFSTTASGLSAWTKKVQLVLLKSFTIFCLKPLL